MWRLNVDTGGTFTDCLALDPQGNLHRAKVLSSAMLRARIVALLDATWIELSGDFPTMGEFLVGFQLRRIGSVDTREIRAQRAATVQLSAPLMELATGDTVELLALEEAPLLAARLVTATPRWTTLPPMHLRLATTRGTNALLEGKTAAAALLVTRGFGDLLRIGTQQRPELFAHPVRLRPPIIETVIELEERIDADGQIRTPLDEAKTRDALAALKARGVAAVAVAFLHSVRNPQHELAVERIARAVGFVHVSVSHRLAAEQGLYVRAQTSAVDAVLRPILRDYLDNIMRELPQTSTTLVMTSAGGLVAIDDFAPKDGLLSGPAGGAMGAAAVAASLQLAEVLSFDMGGTSTDIARIDGEPRLHFTHRVGDAELRAASVAIETVAAGGGSICWIERGLPQVGPQSAGASPGPACYGAGGPLTLTDVNLLLGRLLPEGFPIPLDPSAARQRLRELIEHYERAGQARLSDEEFLAGLLRIANERMAEAMRRVSLREGYDPSAHALIAFGGAAGQHACAVAEELEIATVVLPADASLLSAHGLAHARREAIAQREILRPLSELLPKLHQILTATEHTALTRLRAQGVSDAALAQGWWTLRYLGQDTGLEIATRHTGALAGAFADAYLRRFGHVPAQREIEVVALRCIARGAPAPLEAAPLRTLRGDVLQRRVYLDGRWCEATVIPRSSMVEGQAVQGPALIVEAHSIAVLPAAWMARLHKGGALLLTQALSSAPKRTAYATAIQRELIRHRLTSVALEMGDMLRRTAVSTNIKEREDYSCALLDARGQLVVNAPHIPVHLGALGHCVRSVVAVTKMGPGDAILTNHPGLGGSHLPDLTVISPVHTARGELLGYVASRAHHAEIGGIVPGSMPARATKLIEEGVVFAPTHIARAGHSDLRAVERMLREAPWPSRNVADNLADLAAMLAGNRAGVEAFVALADELGVESLDAHIEGLHHRAADAVRDALRAHGDCVLTAEGQLDDGSPLRVRIEVHGEQARFDFSGSASEHAGNLNANQSIVRSAVIYVLRLWIGGELPFNEGLMHPVELVVPPGLLAPDFSRPPDQCPAVVGGNVETSQQLVELLLRALDLGAASQGTMNNLSFGNAQFGYYETLGGGCGATADCDGASGVHSHMTNTRITDVEVLEHRYPVRVRRFALRPGSGGSGLHRGGDGLIREIEFLQAATLSLLAQSRLRPPRGAHGGHDGKPGAQRLVRADGSRLELDGNTECAVLAGDCVIIKTPGGGGWGNVDAGTAQALASQRPRK